MTSSLRSTSTSTATKKMTMNNGISADQAERDRRVYFAAKQHLTDLYAKFCAGTAPMLDRYLAGPPRPTSLSGTEGVYYHLLASAQNYRQAPNVIERPLGGIDKLAVVLCNFDPPAVLSAYHAQ